MVVACLALFVASTGTSIAASHYLITSTKQIKPSVIKALKGAKGPRGQSVIGSIGPQGPKGATGATGAAGAIGAQGPGGVVMTGVFSGEGTSAILANSSVYVFVDNTTTVTTTASQRLTGAAEVPLGANTAGTSGEAFNYGLCYQPSTGGTITNFAGDTGYSTSDAYPDPRSFAATASVVPGAGTWKVGFCVENGSTHAIDNVDWVNGWVQVTN